VLVLREGLTQKDVELRLWAAEELLHLDPDEKDNVVKALAPSLTDKDLAVQTRVALALVEVDEDAAKQAVPVLREALKDAGTRYTLLGTLAGVLRRSEKRFKAAQPVFEDALKHADVNLRIEALVQLGSLGPIAEPLEKPLREVMKEKDVKIAGAAVEALMRITPRRAGQLFPTLCDLTGAGVPKGVEGESLAPIITGKRKTGRTHLFAAYKDVQRMVRDQNCKLIWYPKVERFQLFDLGADPDEVKDLSEDEAYAKKFAELRAEMARQQKLWGDTAPLLK